MDMVLIALITTIPGIIIAIATLVVSVRNSTKASVINDTAEKINTKSNILLDKTTEIHTLTNSNLSAVTSMLAVANEKISGLEKMVQTMADVRVAKQEKIIVTPEPSPTEGKIIVGTFEGTPKNKKP